MYPRHPAEAVAPLVTGGPASRTAPGVDAPRPGNRCYDAPVKKWLRKKLIDPLKAQLAQGVTPARLAMALALGAVLGVFPVLGFTTLLCGIVAAGLRLNQPAIQVANYAMSAVQLVLFVPFLEGGARMFGQPPVGISVDQLKRELSVDVLATVSHYAAANLRAVVLWAILAGPVAAVLFVLLWRFLRFVHVKRV